MTKDRYNALQNEEDELTPQEIEEGYHFCIEWDGLLIGPGDIKELEVCSCFPSTHPVFNCVKENKVKMNKLLDELIQLLGVVADKQDFTVVPRVIELCKQLMEPHSLSLH